MSTNDLPHAKRATQVWLMDLGTARTRQLTQGDAGSSSPIFSPDGRVKPHGFDPNRKYPLILNVHGVPQDQWHDAFRGDFQLYAGAGYVTAFANPRGSVGTARTARCKSPAIGAARCSRI